MNVSLSSDFCTHVVSSWYFNRFTHFPSFFIRERECLSRLSKRDGTKKFSIIFLELDKEKKSQFMRSSRETRGNFFFETEKEKGREILDRLLRVLFEGRCNWIVSLVWGGVKRWIFLEGERREDCRIISDRNQKCFISSTLISTKVIPLSEKLHPWPCNSEQNLSFFDLSPPPSCFFKLVKNLLENETFFHRLPSVKKFGRIEIWWIFSHSKRNRTRQIFVLYYFYHFILLALDAIPILQIRESIRRNVR